MILIATPSLCYAHTAYLLPPQIYQGDIATLVVEYVNKIPSLYAIDTSALEADFEILEVKSKLNRVNLEDEVSNLMQWKIKISPRRYGELRVPPLKLGDKTTPELRLRVDRPTKEQREAAKVSLSMDAMPSQIYVWQQIEIRVRLKNNIPVRNIQLSEPEAENASSYRSGKEIRYVETVSGEQFEVLERPIIMFAETAGMLEIVPASMQGEIFLRGQRSGRRAIYRSSEPLSLSIRESAGVFSGRHWLPAQQVDLTQDWQGIGDNLQVGDTIGRQLSIRALGLPAEALPDDLLLNESEQFKIYADQSKRSQGFQGKDLEGRLTQSFEIVLTRPGVIDLPELVLRWWDIDEEIEKQAVLPGKRLEVVVPLVSPNPAQTESEIEYRILVWSGWLAALGFTVLLSLLGGKGIVIEYMHGIRQMRQLKKTCLANNAAATRQALLDWANRQWPEDRITGLYQIARRLNSSEVAVELQRLDEALFASVKAPWQGATLFRLFRRHKKVINEPDVSERATLPALYPQ